MKIRRRTKRRVFFMMVLLWLLTQSGYPVQGRGRADQISRWVYPAFLTIETESSKGAGFFVSPEGYIVTAYHVIEGSKKVLANSGAETRWEAKIVNSHPQKDLAVLQVNLKNTPLLRLGETNAKLGEEVYLFGSPIGKPDYTIGRLIADEFDINERRYIQVQASIISGYSGGPVIDKNGNVVGMILQVMGGDLALAVPAGEVSSFLKDCGASHSYLRKDQLEEENENRWWNTEYRWARLPVAGKGLVVIIPLVVILLLILFLRWYLKRRSEKRALDFEIVFHD